MAYTTFDSGGMGRIVRRRIMEDVKWLLKRCGFLILICTDCGNSRNDLLGTTAYGRKESGRGSVETSGGNRGQ